MSINEHYHLDISPFPRTPDGLPDAWSTGEPIRFTPEYESRLEELWRAAIASGHIPTIEWAGSEDGESLLLHDPWDDHTIAIIDVEDPAVQKLVDEQRLKGHLALVNWIAQPNL